MKIFALAVVAFLAIASPALAAPPPNDSFADALRVGIGQEYTGDLAEATAELGEPAHYGPARKSVWFRYRSPRKAHLTVDASGAGGAGLVAVYAGDDLSDLKRVGEAYDYDGIVRFKAKKRTTYFIAIDTFAYGAPIPYTLWVSDGGIKGKGVAMTVDPGQSVGSVRSKGLRLHITARRKVGMAVALRIN